MFSLYTVTTLTLQFDKHKFRTHFHNILKHTHNIYIFFLWRCDTTRHITSSFLRFLDHTHTHTRRTTVGTTPLDKRSARRRDLYLTAHNTHNRQISMPLVEFEPTISTGVRPQTYALDGAATGTGTYIIFSSFLTHCGRVTQICVFNTVKLGTSTSSP